MSTVAMPHFMIALQNYLLYRSLSGSTSRMILAFTQMDSNVPTTVFTSSMSFLLELTALISFVVSYEHDIVVIIY